MNPFRWLAHLFGGGGSVPKGDKRYLTIYALSRRCNEPVSGQVDLLNELSRADDSAYAYHSRKVLHTSGERRCFSQVEISLYFNQDKQIVQHEVEGGRWLTGEEYAVELARFNAPPPEEPEESEAVNNVDTNNEDAPSQPATPKSTQD